MPWATSVERSARALVALFAFFTTGAESSSSLPKAPSAVRVATPDLAGTLYPPLEDFRSVKFGASSNARLYSTLQEEGSYPCASALCIQIGFISAFASDPFLLSGYDSQYEISSPTFDGLQYEMLQPVVEPSSTKWTFQTDFKGEDLDGEDPLPTVDLLVKMRQLSNFHSSLDQLLLRINTRLMSNQTATTVVEVYNVYGTQQVTYRTERADNTILVSIMIEQGEQASADKEVGADSAPLIILGNEPSSCDECKWMLSQCKLSEPCRRLLPCLLVEFKQLSQREGKYDADSGKNHVDLLAPLSTCVRESALVSWAPIAKALVCAARLECNLGASFTLDQTVLRFQEGKYTLLANSSASLFELEHLRVSIMGSATGYSFDTISFDALSDFLNAFIIQNAGRVSISITEQDPGMELAFTYSDFLLSDVPEIFLNDSLAATEQQQQPQSFFEYSSEQSMPSLENLLHELSILVNSTANTSADGNGSWILASECVYCSSLLFGCTSHSITSNRCGYNTANNVFAQCLSDQIPTEVFSDLIQESAGSTGSVSISSELAKCANALDNEFDLSTASGIKLANNAMVQVNKALSCFMDTQCPFGPLDQVSDSNQVQLYASHYVQILRLSAGDFDLVMKFFLGDHVFAEFAFASSSPSIINTLIANLDTALNPAGIFAAVGLFVYEVNSGRLLVEIEYINVALPGFSVSVTSRISGADTAFDSMLVYKNSQMIVQAPISPSKIHRTTSSSPVSNSSTTSTPTPSPTSPATVNTTRQCTACADRYLHNDCRQSAFCQETMLPCVADYLEAFYLSNDSIVSIRSAVEDCVLSNSDEEPFYDWWEPLQNYFTCLSHEKCELQASSTAAPSTLHIELGSIEFVYTSTSNNILEPNFQFSLGIHQSGPGNSFDSDLPFNFHGDRNELVRVLGYMTQDQAANITVTIENLFIVASESGSGSAGIEAGVGSTSGSASTGSSGGGHEAGFDSSEDSASSSGSSGEVEVDAGSTSRGQSASNGEAGVTAGSASSSRSSDGAEVTVASSSSSQSSSGNEAGGDDTGSSNSQSYSGGESGVSVGSGSESQSGSNNEAGVGSGSTSASRSGSSGDAGESFGSSSTSQSGSNKEAGVGSESTSTSLSESGDEDGVVAGSSSYSQRGSNNEAGVGSESTSTSQSGSGDEAGVVAGSSSYGQSGSGDETGVMAGSTSSSQSGNDAEVDVGSFSASQSHSAGNDAGITQSNTSFSQSGSGEETGVVGGSSSSSHSSSSDNDAGDIISSTSSSQSNTDDNETGITSESASSSRSGSGNEAGMGEGSFSASMSGSSSSSGGDFAGMTRQVRVRIAYNDPFLGFLPTISGLQVTASSLRISQPEISVQPTQLQVSSRASSDWGALRALLNEAAQANTSAATCSECENTFHYECSSSDECWRIVAPCLLSELSSSAPHVTYGSDIDILEALQTCTSQAQVQNAQMVMRLLSCYESRQCDLGGNNSTAPTYVQIGSKVQRFRLRDSDQSISADTLLSATISFPELINSGDYTEFVGTIEELRASLMHLTQATEVTLLLGGDTSELSSDEFELEYTGYIGPFPDMESSAISQVSAASNEFAVVFTADNARFQPSITRLLNVLERG